MRRSRGKGDSSAGTVCNFLASTRAATVLSSALCGTELGAGDVLVATAKQGCIGSSNPSEHNGQIAVEVLAVTPEAVTEARRGSSAWEATVAAANGSLRQAAVGSERRRDLSGPNRVVNPVQIAPRDET